MRQWTTIGQFGDAVLREMLMWKPKPLFTEVDETFEDLKIRDRGYFIWLACAVRLLKPKHILELGTLRGFSATAMYSELQSDGMLMTVDIEPTPRCFKPAMEADLRVRVVVGNDLDLSIFGNELPQDIDLLFMDTLHTYEHVSAEWQLYRQFLVSGALVVVDDIIAHDVPRWWNNLPYKTAIEFCEGHSTGLGYFFYEEIHNG